MYDELSIIRAIQRKSDRTAADTLVRQYYDEIHGYMRTQTRNEEDALDLTQETFISMLRTIKLYDSKKGASFRTWLYKVATNKAVDFFRARSARITNTLPLEDVEIAEEMDFIDCIADKDLFEKIINSVNTLPAETQAIFRLRVFGDQTFPQIAESLHMPENSVKSKYHRLLAVLRKEFKNNDRE